MCWGAEPPVDKWLAVWSVRWTSWVLGFQKRAGNDTTGAGEGVPRVCLLGARYLAVGPVSSLFCPLPWRAPAAGGRWPLHGAGADAAWLVAFACPPTLAALLRVGSSCCSSPQSMLDLTLPLCALTCALAQPLAQLDDLGQYSVSEALLASALVWLAGAFMAVPFDGAPARWGCIPCELDFPANKGGEGEREKRARAGGGEREPAHSGLLVSCFGACPSRTSWFVLCAGMLKSSRFFFDSASILRIRRLAS